MPIKIKKTQWGLIMQDADYSRIDAIAATRRETRQEYVRRVVIAAVERDEKKAVSHDRP